MKRGLLIVALFYLSGSLFGQGIMVDPDVEKSQAIGYNLIRMYTIKKDKKMLVQEYLNALEQHPELLYQSESNFATIFENKIDYQMLEAALSKRVRKKNVPEVYHQLNIWQYMQQHEYETALKLLIAQDKRIADDGGMLYSNIRIFTTNEAYPTAINAYEYLLTKGKENEYYLPALLELINVRYQLIENGKSDKAGIAALAAQYDSILNEYGKTPQTLFALKNVAQLKAYYLEDKAAAEQALEEALKIPGISSTEIGNIKLSLGDIYILTQQPWEAILSYEQVAKQFEGQPLGNEARFRTAKLSFYQGNFAYAKSQADVLKASTSQLIANDALNLSLLISDNLQSSTDSSALKMYADAALLEFRKDNRAALIKLDSINISYPKNSLADDILMFKSRIYTKDKDFKQAALVLKQLIEQHTGSLWTDDAIFTLADLYETKLNDSEQAKILFQKLVNDFPGSMYTGEARKRFRKLRGDNLGT